MSEIKMTELAGFIQQFRSATLAQRFQRLKVGYQAVLRESRRTSPRFNVFTVLGVGHYEVKTHSAFLADLLDPYGTHGQEFIFLTAFLKHCSSLRATPSGKLFPAIPGNIESYSWTIRKERGAGEHGILDIVIQSKGLGILYVIENKVWARSEGEGKQLKAYWDWLQRQEEKFPNNALIFLTPDRRKADLPSEVEYFTINYAEDIYEWLTLAFPKIESPMVKTVVQQYRQLILTL